MRLITRGEWPGHVVLRRGWARAEARPWNADFPDAHLRLIRGSTGFIAASASELLECGAPSVLSPPLAGSSQGFWQSAGFRHYAHLVLLRLELDRAGPTPDHLVAVGTEADIDEAIRIDTAAFSPFWRLDKAGVVEAMGATQRSAILVIRNQDAGLCGFAIVGYGSALAYLQRVAVDPPWQGQGMGRSMVRAAARSARARGARALLLNTQSRNEAALNLYDQEGFTRLREPLELMRRSG